MINQTIKATLLFISFILFVLAASEWKYDIHAYLGFIGSAFIALWAVNAVDLFDKWQVDRRKQDLGIDEREYKRLMRREAD